MTSGLPAIVELQKIIAAGLREFENAADHPEGAALAIVEVVHTTGLTIEWRTLDGSLREGQETGRESDK